ncbi:MAG: CatB-related O-acetyltransferase [Lachnospiraceae bacterium]|jgi:acetyltransferase-like isoleucine patch superfamily enzyme|nr:CatB-related O-acetyltransferase [Lachnospiraceae bacterium]
MFFDVVKSKWAKNRFNKKWRSKNGHNETYAGDLFNDSLVEIGNYTYGLLNVLTFDDKSKLKIGNYCSIAPQVCFIVSADHSTNKISTFPFRVKVLHESFEGISKGDIIVDDDVWIGYGATILSGVHIGQGAVIGAGAVVSSDVPPYAIVGGVPARIIRYRFSRAVIEKLVSVDFSNISKDMIVDHINDMYVTVTKDTDLSWLPQKDKFDSNEYLGHFIYNEDDKEGIAIGGD